jgi:hypothetical protein
MARRPRRGSGSDDDLARVNARLTQLMGQNIAQGLMIHRLLGTHALASADWRETLDDLAMMVEWSIKNLEWVGPEAEGEAVRSEALAYLQRSVDELHTALLSAGRDVPPPAPGSNPSSSG